MLKWNEYYLDNIFLEIKNQKILYLIDIKKAKNDLLRITQKAIKLSNLNKEKYVVGLHLVNKETMKKINYKNRKINKSTDVLSFPLLYNNEKEGFYLGDIFINKNILKKQAKEINSNKYIELKFLFMHGLLHLLGYNHKNKKEETIMVNQQKKIFKELGIRGW